MAVLDPNEIMFTAFEPKVQNRFILYVDGIPAYLIMPYIAWGVSLCIFYLLLEEKHENIFMKDISQSS